MKTKINEFAVVMALIIKKIKHQNKRVIFQQPRKKIADFISQKNRCITIILL